MSSGQQHRRDRKHDATGRSRRPDFKHVRLHRWLLRSAAWKALSCYARALLIEMYDLHDGTNNGSIVMAIRDAAKRLGCGKNLAHQAIKELETLGFIRPSVRGAFSLKVKHATTWTLTEFPIGDQPPTKDFLKVDRVAENQNTVPVRGTDGPSRRDTQHATPPVASLHGPRRRDRNSVATGVAGPSSRDTGSIPRGVACNATPAASRNTATPADPDDRDLIDSLADALAASDMSQRQLARRVEIDPPSLSRFLRGLRRLPDPVCDRLRDFVAEVFGDPHNDDAALDVLLADPEDGDDDAEDDADHHADDGIPF